jgi:hypothetical protein
MPQRPRYLATKIPDDMSFQDMLKSITANSLSITQICQQLNNKEPIINTGTSNQYYAGDKTWKNFPNIPTVTPQKQSDWNQGDNTQPEYIKNKPSIPSKTSDITNDSGYITSNIVTSVAGKTGNITLNKSDVGLNNVDNTSDTNKPISIATKTALNSKADLVDGKVPSSQLPSYVDDVLEFSNLSSFPNPGETGKIYTDLFSQRLYRWSGSVYIECSPSDVNSVNNKTGIITLTTADISEQTNLYFTTTRARNAISVTAPLTYSTGVIGINQANGTTNGYLSSTDWNTFNNKQSAITVTPPLQFSSNTLSLPLSSFAPALLFTQIETKTIAGISTESTIIGTGIGTTTLSANYIKAGKTFLIKGNGYINTGLVTVPTINLKLKLGSVILTQTGNVLMVGLGQSNAGFDFEILLTCQSVAADGKASFRVQGTAGYSSVAALNLGARISYGMTQTSAVIIDSTVSQTFDITFQFALIPLASSISITNLYIQALN